MKRKELGGWVGRDGVAGWVRARGLVVDSRNGAKTDIMRFHPWVFCGVDDWYARMGGLRFGGTDD